VFDKFRQKSFPRFHLRSRLDEHPSWREKKYWGENGDFEDRDERSLFQLFPFSALKDMHSFLLFKITLVFFIILIVFLLSLLNLPFSRTIIKNVHYLTTWKTDFVEFGRQAVPVVQSMWDGNPERGLERAVLSTIIGEENEGNNDTHSFTLPLEGQVVKNFGYGYNPVTQKEEMTYGLVFSASGEKEVSASAAGMVSEIKDDSQYGRLLVLKHSGGIETCYGYLRETYVKEGEEVRQGMLIARAGLDSERLNSLLYFEARENGRPFDPLSYFTEQPVP